LAIQSGEASSGEYQVNIRFMFMFTGMFIEVISNMQYLVRPILSKNRNKFVMVVVESRGKCFIIILCFEIQN